jgi:hypothetical protein
MGIPLRRYLSLAEAASWFGVSSDTFAGFRIPYVDLGPRMRRWDIVDIINYANDKKSCDSARTPDDERRGRSCVSSDAKAHPTGGWPAPD